MTKHIQINAIGQSSRIGFDTVESAVLEVVQKRLTNWTIDVGAREITFPERAMLAGLAARHWFEGIWWREQMDRLVRREILTIPDPNLTSNGLERDTAIALRDAFDAAGESGWIAEEGVMRGTGGLANHGWLRHPEEGVILDIACGRLDFLPFRCLTIEADLARNYDSGQEVPIETSGRFAKHVHSLNDVLGGILDQYPLERDIIASEMAGP